MFLILCGNSNLDVLINFVLIKKKCNLGLAGQGDQHIRRKDLSGMGAMI